MSRKLSLTKRRMHNIFTVFATLSTKKKEKKRDMATNKRNKQQVHSTKWHKITLIKIFPDMLNCTEHEAFNVIPNKFNICSSCYPPPPLLRSFRNFTFSIHARTHFMLFNKWMGIIKLEWYIWCVRLCVDSIIIPRNSWTLQNERVSTSERHHGIDRLTNDYSPTIARAK